MSVAQYYRRIVSNIIEAETPYEILSNIDNFKFIEEREKYENKRRM